MGCKDKKRKDRSFLPASHTLETINLMGLLCQCKWSRVSIINNVDKYYSSEEAILLRMKNKRTIAILFMKFCFKESYTLEIGLLI